jgi:hypothetical protein
LSGYLDWPGVGQVMRRHCERIVLKTGEITSTATSKADGTNPETGAVCFAPTVLVGRQAAFDHVVILQSFTSSQGHAGNGIVGYVAGHARRFCQ